MAHARVIQRARHEEDAAVTLDYLRDLHELHEDWLVRKTRFQPLPAPVLILDANGEVQVAREVAWRNALQHAGGFVDGQPEWVELQWEKE